MEAQARYPSSSVRDKRDKLTGAKETLNSSVFPLHGLRETDARGSASRRRPRHKGFLGEENHFVCGSALPGPTGLPCVDTPWTAGVLSPCKNLRSGPCRPGWRVLRRRWSSEGFAPPQ
jgi:hypothetical protein